jgi:hypothetical protein
MDEFEATLLLFGDPGDYERLQQLKSLARREAIKEGRLVTWESPTGQLMWVHNPANCSGQACVFHNPSKHGMNDWPVNVRESNLIERMCDHGIGHPDPDSVAYFDRMNQRGFDVHGCDGCCHEPSSSTG